MNGSSSSFALEELEGLAQPHVNNRVERLALDLLCRQNRNRPSARPFRPADNCRGHAALLDLEFLRARHRDAQTHRDVVRDVIAADREDAALFHRAVDIENVIGRPAADIDDERAEILLMLGEDDLGGSEGGEDDVLDIERQFLHAADRVLNPRAHAVDDVEIGLQFLAEHSDRIEHAVLSVDVIMLDDRMQKRVLRRNAHLARVDLHVLDILLVDLVAIFRQHDAAAIVEALNVRAGDADVDAANHDVAFLFGIDHRLVHALHRRLEIDDLALAHAARRRLADAENLDRAVGPAFADDDANLRCSDFETDHQDRCLPLPLVLPG